MRSINSTTNSRISILLAAVFGVIAVCVFCSAANGTPWAGSGVEGDPYLIYDANDMQAIGADEDYWDAHFKLMADVDLSAYTGASFNIIGNGITAFTGIFDGQSHRIQNFTWDSGDEHAVGIFGVIDSLDARVFDIWLENPSTSGGTGYYPRAGTLAGSVVAGTIEGCKVINGEVAGTTCRGGLIGKTDNEAVIRDCNVACTVTGTTLVGGIVGINEGQIVDCHFNGDVSGLTYIGGITGLSRDYISTCSSAGTVTIVYDPGARHDAGGLVGYNEGTILLSYSSAAVSGGEQMGGLVGRSDGGSIEECYATGYVSGSNSIGGLVGENLTSDIRNCYASGSVSGNLAVGGLLGSNDNTYSPYCEVEHCYSVGQVSGSGNVGGLVGWDESGAGDFEKCFWNTTVNPSLNGIGNITDPNVIGETTANMKLKTTYESTGWNFITPIWTIENGLDYPKLWWEIAAGGYGGGSGTAGDPYLIYTPEQLNTISRDFTNLDKYFKLMADIDLSAYSGEQFNIIGDQTDPFKGVFDGNGHTISNFTWRSESSSLVGLFGYIDGPNAEIRNLTLIDPNIQGYRAVGPLVGHLSDGTIVGCAIEGGTVSGEYYSVGGMVGLAGYNSNCIISECYSSSSVTGDRSAGGLVGGGGYISNCYATGSVTGARNIGGLVGYSSGIISNCYSTGSVTGTDEVGGLIGGDADTLIISSYWDIETSGQTISHGGRGKTTIQMKTASTFVGWGGYDNYGTWTIDDGDYPRLSWQGLPGTQLPDLELVDYLYGGSGQANDPYLISNAEELSLAGMFPWELDKHFKLIADINLIDYNENNFNIIGYYVYPVSYAFTGVFDGNGHTISNFTWRSESMADYSGLFGTINGAEIKDLRLIDPNVQATNETGALVGYSVNGEIFGCYIEGGTVSGGPAGGIIGVNHSGIISKCYSTCSVTGEAMIGGLAGTNKGTISNCYATGSVTGEDILGGLVGTVRSDSTISNCYATGSVTGEDDVGGLVGKLYYDSTISNCCATGSVTGDDDVGGLVGYLYYDGIISNCYATGSVTGNEDVGGLVGYDYGGFYAKCFWDSDVNPDVNGIGNTTDPNVTGESTANMQTMSTFTDAGWDFVGEVINGPNDIWRMCIDGVEYPKLWWEFTTGDFVCPDGVDFVDFAVLANTWLLEDGDAGYNSVCDISIPADETIDMLDLEVFSGNWLEGIQEP